jgi:hypothetical protein
MKRLLVLLFLINSAFAGTWIMSPGKGSHGSSVPTGNSWTIVGYTSAENTLTWPGPAAGSIGDILVVRISWSGGGTLTAISGDASGAATLRGTQVNASNGDKSARWATLTSTTTTSDNFTPTFSGSGTFRNWQIWRLSASGTKDYTVTAIGNGTGTALATGTFTTATVNGIVLAGADIYGTATASSPLIGGNAATNFRNADTFSKAWDYIHTSQLSGATANLTINTSFIWIANALALSAQ